MMMQSFRCRHCKKIRQARVKGQAYCGDKDCQKARKNAWQRKKYATDIDYRLNQKASTKAWMEKQGGVSAYFRNYRSRRKDEDKAKENETSHVENTKNTTRVEERAICANSDAIFKEMLMKTARYYLSPFKGANSDAIVVEIRLISTG